MKLNPVMRKELKVRMRNWKSAGMIMTYVGVLMLVVVFVLIATVFDGYSHSFDRQDFIMIYTVLAALQASMITFIVPGLTAGSISGERERQTLDILLSTKLSTKSIILGKLFTSISQILLLIVASLPVFSIIFMFGGISMFELLQLLLFYVVLTITIGSIGIFFSTYIKRTTPATVLTYAIVALIMLGTFFFAALYYSIVYGGRSTPNVFLPMYINPVTGFISLLASQFGTSSNAVLPRFFMGSASSKIPFWVINIIVDLIMSAILLFFASVKLNPVKRKKRLRNKKA